MEVDSQPTALCVPATSLIPTWHEHAANYIALGWDRAKIARACGVTEAAVLAALKLKHFQAFVHKALEQRGVDALTLVDMEATATVCKLIALRDDIQASKQVQLKATEMLLDRKWGKAVQNIVTQNNKPSVGTPVEEVEKLQREVEELRSRNEKSRIAFIAN